MVECCNGLHLENDNYYESLSTILLKNNLWEVGLNVKEPAQYPRRARLS